MRITDIDVIPVEVPYHERIREYLQKGWGFANRATDQQFKEHREVFEAEWRRSVPPVVDICIYKVHTDDGPVGLAEGAHISTERLATYRGRSPFEFLGDDSVGPLQMAFYDLMGKAEGLPAARLMGPLQRQSVPVAYWSHCFPPDILAEEARIAVANGFKVHKFKRRAHTDVTEQAAAIAEVAPSDYRITVDSNATPGLPSRALEIARSLEQIPIVRCLESPLPQDNVDGYLFLKSKLDYPLAIHMGTPDPLIAVTSGMCDYFVSGGGVSNVRRQATIAAAGGNMPFWMQTAPCTGLQAVFMIHIAAAVKNASLSHVTTHFIVEDDLLTEPVTVENGYFLLSDRPGLGVELDEDAVEKYRKA